MAEKKAVQEENEVVRKARGFWANYNKPFLYIVGALVLVLAGWAVYKYMFKMPKEEKANDAIFVVQKFFNDFTTAPMDSTKALLAAKVINGDGANPGALKIISRYSGTAAANLSNYYAGACYLQLGQFEKALDYLGDFDANGATQIKSRALGMMGDANAELKKNDQALEYYKKAASVNEKDDYTSAEYLYRAAMFADYIGNSKEAVSLFKKIKKEYPLSEKALDVDKYLAKLGDVSE